MINAQGKGSKTKTKVPACPYILFDQDFEGNDVSGQFGFLLNGMSTDMFLTHSC